MRAVTLILSMLAARAIVSTTNAGITHYGDESAWQAVITDRALADFEGFTGNITDQYTSLGATFFPFNSGTPYTDTTNLPFPPPSQPQFMAVRCWGCGGGGWAAEFDPPVEGVGFWTFDVQYSDLSWVTLRDQAGEVLGTFTLSAYGAWNWGFEGAVSDTRNIARVEVADAWSDHIAYDNVQWGIPEPAVTPGDLNCDGSVNFKDINPFVAVLTDPSAWQATYPGCPLLNGDTNFDGSVNFKDINPFVALLSGGLGPRP